MKEEEEEEEALPEGWRKVKSRSIEGAFAYENIHGRRFRKRPTNPSYITDDRRKQVKNKPDKTNQAQDLEISQTDSTYLKIPGKKLISSPNTTRLEC